MRLDHAQARDVAARFARAALFYFVVVGILGTWLRARFVGLMPLALQPANVIHAHSHVAFFGWASPALFAGIYYVLPRLTGQPLAGVSVIHWQLRLTHLATIGALITFAAGGYNPASIVFSSLNGLVWYAFVWVYWKNTAGLPRPLPVTLRYFHVATALLVLCSLGTWIVGGLTGAGVTNPLWQAFGLHLFLNNFIDGWLLVGLLGLMTFLLSDRSTKFSTDHSVAARGDDAWAARPLLWMAVLTPLSFFADVIPAEPAPVLAVIGVVTRTALVLPYGVFLWRALQRYFVRMADDASRKRQETRPRASAAAVLLLAMTVFLLGKIVAHAGSIVAALVPSRQLTIAYLHLNLLGFFSVGIVGVLYVLASGGDLRQSLRTADGVVGPSVLAAGTAGMVGALFVAAVADVALESMVRARTLEWLLQAAFAFAVVSLAGMAVTGVQLGRRWKPVDVPGGRHVEKSTCTRK